MLHLPNHYYNPLFTPPPPPRFLGPNSPIKHFPHCVYPTVVFLHFLYLSTPQNTLVPLADPKRGTIGTHIMTINPSHPSSKTHPLVDSYQTSRIFVPSIWLVKQIFRLTPHKIKARLGDFGNPQYVQASIYPKRQRPPNTKTPSRNTLQVK